MRELESFSYSRSVITVCLSSSGWINLYLSTIIVDQCLYSIGSTTVISTGGGGLLPCFLIQATLILWYHDHNQLNYLVFSTCFVRAGFKHSFNPFEIINDKESSPNKNNIGCQI